MTAAVASGGCSSCWVALTNPTIRPERLTVKIVMSLQSARQLLLEDRHWLEEVAGFLDSCDHFVGLELNCLDILSFGSLFDFAPGQRRRDPWVLASTQRIHRDGRFVLIILTPVDEH